MFSSGLTPSSCSVSTEGCVGGIIFFGFKPLRAPVRRGSLSHSGSSESISATSTHGRGVLRDRAVDLGALASVEVSYIKPVSKGGYKISSLDPTSLASLCSVPSSASAATLLRFLLFGMLKRTVVPNKRMKVVVEIMVFRLWM